MVVSATLPALDKKIEGSFFKKNVWKNNPLLLSQSPLFQLITIPPKTRNALKHASVFVFLQNIHCVILGRKYNHGKHNTWKRRLGAFSENTFLFIF
jgi:hypothetical protein